MIGKTETGTFGGIVNNLNPQSKYLMLDKKGHSLIPVVGSAFSTATAKGFGVSKFLNQEYKDVLLVDSDGKNFSIEKIDVLGLLGKTWFEKFTGLLTGTYELRTDFKEMEQKSLEEIKELTIQLLTCDQKTTEPNFILSEPLQGVIDKIKNASNTAEIFNHINFPSPEDCLDVL